MTARWWYAPFGLRVASELPLPELVPGVPGGTPDVTIRLGDTAAQAARAARCPEDGQFANSPHGAVMITPGVGSFLLRDGREVHVTPEPDGDRARLHLILIGSSLGMVLHQRGALVLHGATIAHEKGATVFVGASTAGKSTLAAALAAAGLQVLGDDLMPVTWEAGWPVVRLGSRVLKLWGDTISAFGLEGDRLGQVLGRLDKFFVRNRAEATGPRRLAEVVVLERSGDAPPELTRLRGLAAIETLSTHTYRPHYLSLLDRRDIHFHDATELAREIPVYRMSRPWDLGRMDETVTTLRAHWAALAEDGEVARR